jgi:hypothetical protein
MPSGEAVVHIVHFLTKIMLRLMNLDNSHQYQISRKPVSGNQIVSYEQSGHIAQEVGASFQDVSKHTSIMCTKLAFVTL